MGARSAGVLVHPTALPGPFGIGDLGPSTVRFLDRMAEAGLRVWQVLPLGPTGPDHSPYACRSAFAGSPLLISPRRLAHAGWLPEDSEGAAPRVPSGRADFDRTWAWKSRLLRTAWETFQNVASHEARLDWEAFVEQPERKAWLEDWALFCALREAHDGRPWCEWDEPLRRREPRALARAARELADEVRYRRFLQFLFFRQWNEVRAAAGARGIEIFGDLPYYVAPDSADVWAHREAFRVDADGRPLLVGGVPPDYFSETGQLWGHPTYDWARLADSGFAWWVERVRANFALVDRLRLDHFRGFEAYWEVDAGAETAAEGRWVEGPGRRLFDTLRASLGSVALVAEDLGDITDQVDSLREELGLPGMHVLQFAFDGGEARHAPEAHRPDAVVYTGTHDNDTTRGWFESLEEAVRRRVLERLGTGPETVVWRMIETAFHSPCGLAVVPLQDLLGLGSEARMNRPGAPVGNWDWRASNPPVDLRLVARVRDLSLSSGRFAAPGG